MININEIKIGDKVHYKTSYCHENGMIKEIVDNDYVRVVYHCDNNWKNFKNYTSALTATKNLYLGWN